MDAKIAAVGNHGRVLALCTTLFVVAHMAAALPQTSIISQDVPADLAARIVSALPPGTRVVTITAASDSAEDTALVAELSSRLLTRGIAVSASSDDVPSIRVGCLRNLRERSCSAEVRAGTSRELAMVTRPDEGDRRGESAGNASLELRLLYSQRTPMLDVAVLGDRLWVLDTGALTVYQRGTSGWQRSDARPVGPLRVWPRDPRGRLRIDGDRIDVWLPGMTCLGAATPFALNCSDRTQAWPLGLDNGGLDGARNYFITPEGLAFYSAAVLSDKAGARWIVADREGNLTWVDETRRATGRAASAADVIGVSALCGLDKVVLAVDHAAGARSDALRAFNAVGRRLVPIASPVVLPGRSTALWPSPVAGSAMVIIHDPAASRYDAFQITVLCGR